MIVKELHASLEELWSALDKLFTEMSPADWQRPHGEEWVFADLPYHLAYMDRLCVAWPIELGELLPVTEQVQLPTINELNAWNLDQFAARPEDQKVETSLVHMHSSREYVREVTATMIDADLAKPAWFPLLNMRGFRSAQIALAFCAGHTWQHLEEARVRYGQSGTLVGPELTHAMMNGIIPGIPLYLPVPATTLFLDADRAKKWDFSFALNINGPGGGIWEFFVADEGWQVEGVDSAETDLLLSLDLDAYIKIRYFINDVPTLIKTGEIEVNDDQALSLYNKLYVVPDFDYVFPRMT